MYKWGYMLRIQKFEIIWSVLQIIPVADVMLPYGFLFNSSFCADICWFIKTKETFSLYVGQHEIIIIMEVIHLSVSAAAE